MLLTWLGVLCVAYTAVEVARAWSGAPGAARFGAVDAETGRRIEVTLDRRTRARRAGDR
jgi:hypothetical protein